MNRIKSASLSLLLTAFLAATAFADGWRLGFGVHDFYVPDMESHTYGIGGGISYEKTTDSGFHWFGSYDLFKDFDKDELDPDHIPIWWKLHIRVDRPMLEISPQSYLSWEVAHNSKTNTVSSIEREIKIFPAILYNWENERFKFSLKAAAGYFFLEIDDDVPKSRGYARGDFRSDGFAYSFAANGTVNLGQSFQLFGQFQRWADEDTWLENQYLIELRYDADHWFSDSELVLGIEGNHYNLLPYTPSYAIMPVSFVYLPILPWDDDVMVRLSFTTKW